MFSFPWLYIVSWVTSVGIIIWWYEQSLKNLRNHNTDTKHRADFIEEELAACRKKNHEERGAKEVNQVVKTDSDLNSILEQTPNLISQKDDLKIVEGIGPKIEKLLHNASIFTFSELSQAKISDIKKILESAGSRYLMHDPTTWPKQAELAMEGRWDELKKWQSELDKGRIV